MCFFSWITPRSGAPGYRVDIWFNVERDRQSSHFTRPPAVCAGGPHPHQHPLLAPLSAILAGVKWHPVMVLICISLVTSEVENLLMCLWGASVYLLLWSVCQVFCPFYQVEWFVFWWLSQRMTRFDCEAGKRRRSDMHRQRCSWLPRTVVTANRWQPRCLHHNAPARILLRGNLVTCVSLKSINPLLLKKFLVSLCTFPEDDDFSYTEISCIFKIFYRMSYRGVKIDIPEL